MDISQLANFDGRRIRIIGEPCELDPFTVVPVQFDDDGRCAILALKEDEISQWIPNRPDIRRAFNSATELPSLKYLRRIKVLCVEWKGGHDINFEMLPPV